MTFPDDPYGGDAFDANSCVPDVTGMDPVLQDDPYAIDTYYSGTSTPDATGTGMPDGTGGSPEVRFGSGGYSGSYDGISNCWFSSDGYVYAPDGTRIGAH